MDEFLEKLCTSSAGHLWNSAWHLLHLRYLHMTAFSWYQLEVLPHVQSLKEVIYDSEDRFSQQRYPK